MGREEVIQQMRDFVVSNFLFGEGAQLHNDDSFMEKGLIDSTGILELVAFIEEKYGICVEDQDLIPDNLDSVVAASNFVVRRLNGGATA